MTRGPPLGTGRPPSYWDAYAEPALLLLNDGRGRFRDASTEAGPAFTEPVNGRGLAVGDIDGDGDPDLLVTVGGGGARLLRNDLAPAPLRSAGWLAVRVVDAASGVDLPGARVTVTSAGRRWVGVATPAGELPVERRAGLPVRARRRRGDRGRRGPGAESRRRRTGLPWRAGRPRGGGGDRRGGRGAPALSRPDDAEMSRQLPPAARPAPGPLRAGLRLGAALLVVATATAGHAADGPRETVQAPPSVPAAAPKDLPALPDLSGVEAPVAAKIAAARRFVGDHPDSAHAWGLVGMSLDVHGFATEALPYYRRAAELAPDEFRWPYYRALALAAAGDPAAVAASRRPRALAPAYAPLEVRRGRALAAAGDRAGAAAAFGRAVELDPDLPHAHLELARLALAGDDPERALAEARRALAADPRFGEAHGLLAELLRRRGEAAGADAELAIAERLPATTPLPDPVYAALAAEGVSSFWRQRRGRAYLDRGDWARAARELGEALAAAGDAPRPELHDDLGLALQGLGRWAEAADQHRAAVVLRSDFAAALAHLGEALAETGDLDGAVAAVAHALDLRPDLTAAALDLGTLQARAGRRAEAAAAFRRGLAAAPDDPRLAARLAWLLATAPEDGLRDGAEAVRLAEAASRATGDRLAEALDVLAAAYAEAGRFAEAATTAARARDLAAAAGDARLAGEIAARRALYGEGKPYRQATAPPDGPPAARRGHDAGPSSGSAPSALRRAAVRISIE